MERCKCDEFDFNDTGKTYKHVHPNFHDVYILANLGWSRKRMISLRDGNRFQDKNPTKEEWKEVKVCYKEL